MLPLSMATSYQLLIFTLGATLVKKEEDCIITTMKTECCIFMSKLNPLQLLQDVFEDR